VIVERAGRANFSSPVQLAALGANATTFSDTTVAPRTKYFYRITARNAVGSRSSAILQTQTPRR